MDKEFLSERRRALEEEYFAKLNRALLKRLRAAEAANEEMSDAPKRREMDGNVSSGHLSGREPALEGFGWR